MKLSELLKNCAITEIRGPSEQEISGIFSESRKVEEGGLFAAISGTHVDGHTFIDEAVRNGAHAVICEKFPENLIPTVSYILVARSQKALGTAADTFFDHPSSKLKLIGITGTNGKTTIATLLYKLFETLGHSSGLLSTVINMIHDRVFPATHTTPDTIELHRLMAKMVRDGVMYCFMEVSSHAIDQDRIAGLTFSGGVFTNLSHDHLDYHKTIDAYAAAKKKFFDELPGGAFALTNKDDAKGISMTADTPAKKFVYGESDADFTAKISKMDIEKMELLIDGAPHNFSLVGKFNMQNILAVFGTAVLLGEEKGKVLTTLSGLSGAVGRFEKIRSPGGITAIVDYAHTPDALENVLKTIAGVKEEDSRIITVVGCGGDRDPSKRSAMGKIAASMSDVAYFTSDNPRDEEPNAILSAMMPELSPEEVKKVTAEPDRMKAINLAIAAAKKGDIVLIAGKGHETYQEIAGMKQPFSDSAIAAKILETR